MIGIAALVVGIVLGLVFHPSVPEFVQPYLPIAVVAALDAVFGGLRAYLERIFDSKVFVVSFVFNVLVAALIVYVGDQLGVGTQLSTAIIVVLGHPDLRQRRRLAAQAVRGVTHEPTHDSPTTRPSRARHGRHELPPDEPRRPDRRPAAAQASTACCGGAGRSWCSGRWPSCCACCSASRSSPRSGRPSPATRWRPPAPPTCWCCWTRCSSARRR